MEHPHPTSPGFVPQQGCISFSLKGEGATPTVTSPASPAAVRRLLVDAKAKDWNNNHEPYEEILLTADRKIANISQ
jgi:hypothetical protein